MKAEILEIDLNSIKLNNRTLTQVQVKDMNDNPITIFTFL